MLSQTEESVRKTLIKVCRGKEKTTHHRKITYKELWEKHNSSGGSWGQGCTSKVVDWIVNISYYDVRAGLPPLNSIVVRKDTGEPGEDWEEWHKSEGSPYGSLAHAQTACWAYWPEKNVVGDDSQPIIEFKWDVFKHIDSIREGRTNFFLVAEAMMIAAYMALSSTETFLRTTVSVLGIIYTVSWFFINLRQSNRLDYLGETNLLLGENNRHHKKFFLGIVKAGKGLPGKHIMNYVLPLSTAFFWVVLLIKA